MNANHIRSLVDNGIKVYWSNPGYEVIKDSVVQIAIFGDVIYG